MEDNMLIGDWNTTLEVRGADGRPKQLWQENFLGRWLREKLGREFRVPFLTGWNSFQMVNHNVVCNSGLAVASALLGNVSSPTAFTAIAVGTGATAASATDTALQTESTTGGMGRGAATASLVTTTVTNDTLQLVKTFTASASFAITEEGILNNNVSGGTLLAHQVFSAVNLVSGDQLTITHKVQV